MNQLTLTHAVTPVGPTFVVYMTLPPQLDTDLDILERMWSLPSRQE